MGLERLTRTNFILHYADGTKKTIEEIYTSLFDRIIKNKFPADSGLKEDKLAEEYQQYNRQQVV